MEYTYRLATDPYNEKHKRQKELNHIKKKIDEEKLTTLKDIYL